MNEQNNQSLTVSDLKQVDLVVNMETQDQGVSRAWLDVDLKYLIYSN